jgi:hypothetical protein
MIKIFKEIVRHKVTPNEFYILYCMIEGQELGVFNIDEELLQLKSRGYLDDHGVYTDKAAKLVKHIDNMGKKKYVLSEEDITHINTYREMFPKGNLPSGYPARVNVKDLQKRFVWFMQNYEYSWETILEATRMYIEKYKAEDYKYMKTSAYFIFKSENGETISQLANFCDMVTEGEEVVVTPNYTSHTVL